MQKKPASSVAEDTLEVRFIAPDIAPEKIPLRSVSDALSAVQDLASGRDPYLTSHVPLEKGIGLVDVRAGSAVYVCVSRAPKEALRNLTYIGALLANKKIKESLLAASLRPIKLLSEIAKHVNCRVEVTVGGKSSADPLFTIVSDDYERLAKRILLTGDATVYGTVERIGGATGLRCLMRIPGRRKLLYCNVRGRDLARKLGPKLYENIAATGVATWIRPSWRIHAFTITGFSQPKLGNVEKAIEKLREAGLSAWDEIENPESYVRGMR